MDHALRDVWRGELARAVGVDPTRRAGGGQRHALRPLPRRALARHRRGVQHAGRGLRADAPGGECVGALHGGGRAAVEHHACRQRHACRRLGSPSWRGLARPRCPCRRRAQAPGARAREESAVLAQGASSRANPVCVLHTTHIGSASCCLAATSRAGRHPAAAGRAELHHDDTCACASGGQLHAARLLVGARGLADVPVCGGHQFWRLPPEHDRRVRAAAAVSTTDVREWRSYPKSTYALWSIALGFAMDGRDMTLCTSRRVPPHARRRGLCVRLPAHPRRRREMPRIGAFRRLGALPGTSLYSGSLPLCGSAMTLIMCRSTAATRPATSRRAGTAAGGTSYSLVICSHAI